MSKKQLDQIIDRLNILIKIAIASTFKGKKDEAILILSNLGIKRAELADLIGTTVKYVDKVRYQSRKKQKKTKTRGRKKKEVEQK